MQTVTRCNGAEQSATQWRADWMHSARHDLALALLWVPFTLATIAVRHDSAQLRWLVTATLLFSFAHQPLTLWLVYGDAAQRRAHAAAVRWAPAVLLVAVATATSIRPELVALVAAIWNVAHTLRQRYGLCKMYGRSSGIDCSADNRLLSSWLASAVIVAFARTDLDATARAVGLGRRNRAAVDTMAAADPVLTLVLPVVLTMTALITVRWVQDELRRTTHSTPRLVYLASTAVLLVVLAVEPIIGFVGYVGAHAAEYFFVVRWRIDRSAQHTAIAGDSVGWLARRIGGIGTVGIYLVAVVALILGLRALQPSAVAPVVILTLGGLHLFFDGVIWRSPRSVPAATTVRPH